jgi:iron-regulated transporter 1
VELFTGSLLPASIYGFVITAFGILFSGSVAALVDSTPRLRAVRFCILGQKFSSAVVYAVFLAMFLHFTKQGGKRGKGEGDAARLSGQEAVWFLFAAIVLGGSALKLATVGINVAIERDWAMQISRGSEQNLTRINLIM